MVFHRFGRGHVVLRTDPRAGESRLNKSDTVEVTGDAVVHILGDATRLWVFGRGCVYVHGEVDEVYVLGHSHVTLSAPCRMVDVGMHGTVTLLPGAAGSMVIVNQHGTVHAGDEVKVRAFGESRVHAPATADVVLHWFAQWHTGSEVRGNTSLYRPGYCVVR